MANVMLDGEMVLSVSIGGKGGDKRTRSVRLGDFPAPAIERVLRYGFTRYFSDRVGGSDMTVDDKEAAIEEMIAAFKRGELPQRQARAGVDPVLHEARKLLRAALSKEQRERLKAYSDEEQLAKIDALLAVPANAKFTEQAKKLVAAKAKATQVDLGDMDI